MKNPFLSLTKTNDQANSNLDETVSSSAFSRRAFLKRGGGASVAMAAAALSVAVQPVSAGDGETVGSYRRDYQYGIIITGYPKDGEGNFLESAASEIDIKSSGNTTVGKLKLTAVHTSRPNLENLVSSYEMSEGPIPPEKVFSEIELGQKGKVEYSGNWLSLFSAGYASLGFVSTPGVTTTLDKYQDQIGPWKVGDPVPQLPPIPVYTYNPEEAALRSIAPSLSNLSILGTWSNWGWSWVGVATDDSNLQLTSSYVGSWTPGAEEGKTNSVVLIWQLRRVKRYRTLFKAPEASQFVVIAAVDNPEDEAGWENWRLA